MKIRHLTVFANGQNMKRKELEIFVMIIEGLKLKYLV